MSIFTLRQEIIYRPYPELLISGGLTVFCWVKGFSYTGLGEGFAVAFHQNVWHLNVDERISLGWRRVGGPVTGKASDIINTNAANWHTYTAVRNTLLREVSFYLDGSLINTVSYSSSDDPEPPPFDEENQWPYIFTSHEMYVAEVAVWNTALTSSQVASLYNNGTGAGTVPKCVSPSNLRFYVPFRKGQTPYLWTARRYT
jgi:hypothetical protein